MSTDGCAREEAGFGLIELVIALAILNVVILALFATFNAGSLALQRASRISTAETLADKQMELYRARLYKGIGLENTLSRPPPETDPHRRPRLGQRRGQFTDPRPARPPLDECKPIQTGVTGPDSRTYRIDTYVASSPPAPAASGRSRRQACHRRRPRPERPAKCSPALQSTFDQATGCTGHRRSPADALKLPVRLPMS